MDYPLTEEQQVTLDQAISLLNELCPDVRTSAWTGYFEEQDENGERIGDHDFREYDTCDNDECLNHNHAILEEKYLNLNIQYRWYQNDGDHYKFEICTVCGKHLHEFLTWIEYELTHHIENTITKEDINDPVTAYELSSIFHAMHWNADERMGTHYAANHHDEGIERQKAFIKKVVEYAQFIINKLK